MKRFLLKFSLFSFPLALLSVVILWIDIFKIFGFQDYYSNQKVALNRGTITTMTFNHFRGAEAFNSFIFGSSRSQAFKCDAWSEYLSTDAKAFHFDASGEDIEGIAQKLTYINALGGRIENALVVLDAEALNTNHNRQGHLYVRMPCISKEPKAHYYATFLKASLNMKLLVAYADFSLFDTRRDYMEGVIINNKYDHMPTIKNCDVWYGLDREIQEDSLAFYRQQISRGIFFERPSTKVYDKEISEDEINHLRVIKSIFNKHNTSYKVIISPLYDQIPLREPQLSLLKNIFGEEQVFDYSGKNGLTQPIHNYYETSHYRPHVANQILAEIYSRK